MKTIRPLLIAGSPAIAVPLSYSLIAVSDLSTGMRGLLIAAMPIVALLVSVGTIRI